jgi:large subunit ribosomal protein L23
MQHERIVRKALITEKANRLREMNVYQFEVLRTANKKQIKQAIEYLFSVEVVKIKVSNYTGKPRRLGRSSGYTTGYKKASVTLKEGQTIEIAEGV